MRIENLHLLHLSHMKHRVSSEDGPVQRTDTAHRLAINARHNLGEFIYLIINADVQWELQEYYIITLADTPTGRHQNRILEPRDPNRLLT
jgi:hypothetical protein